MIAQLLNQLMNVFLVEAGAKTNAASVSHKLLLSDIPGEMLKQYPEKYIIYGSEGNGRRALNPWVGIFNSSVTKSAQKGIYVVLLFKRDMSGFYLTLDQGITFYRDHYKSKAYAYANKVCNYFRSQYQLDGFVWPINVGGVEKKKDRGYGYEQTTIFGRYFEKGHFTDEVFWDELSKLLSVYDEIVDALYPYDYETQIQKLLNTPDDTKINVDEAEREIEEALVEPGHQSTEKKQLIIVDPSKDKLGRLGAFTTDPKNKIDYLQRAKENARVGLVGENLVLGFEKLRVAKETAEEAPDSVKWVAEVNDLAGYDIESYIFENGHKRKIYIEVKTTNSRYNTDFFVSENERLKSLKYRNYYFVYRIYDCDSVTPKCYIVRGSIPSNFILDKSNYKARLKPNANIIAANVILDPKDLPKELIKI